MKVLFWAGGITLALLAVAFATYILGVAALVVAAVTLLAIGVYRMATRTQRQPWFPAALAVLALMVLVVPPAFAADNVINVGAAFGAFQPYIDSVVSSLIFVGLSWLAYILKSRWNIQIDQGMRDTLQTWLQRQAGSLTAAGAVRVSGLTITVGNAAVASAANLAIKEIPDAIAHFGLTPEKLGEMIIDKIPQVPTVAAVAAATAPAQAAAE